MVERWRKRTLLSLEALPMTTTRRTGSRKAQRRRGLSCSEMAAATEEEGAAGGAREARADDGWPNGLLDGAQARFDF